MSAYLSKLLGFSIFSIFILIQYYGIEFHIKDFLDFLRSLMIDGTISTFVSYLATLAIAYGVYKFFTLTSKRDKASFSPLSIILYTLLHLFILCFVYFGLTGGVNGGFVLFFKIFGYLLLPATLTLIVYSLGKKTLHRFVPSFEQEETAFRFLLSLGFGFVLFLTALTIAGTLGFYNIVTVA